MRLRGEAVRFARRVAGVDNLVAIIPTPVGSTVAIDAQFRNAAETLYIVGPVEIEGGCGIGLKNERSRNGYFQGISFHTVRDLGKALPLPSAPGVQSGLLIARDLEINQVIITQPSGGRITIAVQEQQHP